jgi:hypothetical protein
LIRDIEDPETRKRWAFAGGFSDEAPGTRQSNYDKARDKKERESKS